MYKFRIFERKNDKYPNTIYLNYAGSLFVLNRKEEDICYSAAKSVANKLLLCHLYRRPRVQISGWQILNDDANGTPSLQHLRK